LTAWERTASSLHLLPLGVSTLLLVYAQTPYILPLFMAITGLTAVSSRTLLGALWAELYGTKHLGAIRALATAGVIFASALSPGLIGVLLDGGIAIERQLLVVGLYCFAAAAWMALLMPRLRRLAAS